MSNKTENLLSEIDKRIKQIEELAEKRLQTILAQRAELARLQSKEQPPCETCKHSCDEMAEISIEMAGD